MADPSTPTYLSARAADVVLSDIRPTRLAPDALRSINVLLDELLWMILSTARSFSTEQLKLAMGRVLPTPLGKEGLLEAEVELKAYWDRTASPPGRPYTENAPEFPIQPAFELLRLKCEAYSTFNDSDENTDTERRWQSKVVGSGVPPHNMQFIAPAALYLTAIIEHVCEHILSNAGRVTARDSSRSTANLQDLFTALCEDDAIYGLFKNMKVYSQIEQQSKASATKLRKSRSFTRNVSGEHGRVASQSTFGAGASGEATPAKPRSSIESTGSGTANAAISSANSRSSTEKSKAKKLFGRISVDREGSSGHAHTGSGRNSVDFGHKRSNSVMSNSKRSASAAEEAANSSPSEVEFDELMRSGTTMKVSLTPDRLRTFDVYNKDKSRGGLNKIGTLPPPSPLSGNRVPLQDSAAVNVSSSLADDASKSSLTQHDRSVTSIAEDEDSPNSQDATNSNSAPVLSRQPSSYKQPAQFNDTARSRAQSVSQAQSQSPVSSIASRVGLARKGSINALAIDSSQARDAGISSGPKTAGPISGSIYRKKLQHTMSQDSMDFDDDSDDDLLPPGRRRKPGMGGRPRASTGVSSQTADLIDFLNSGPPPDVPAIDPNVVATANAKAKQRGRLRSIVSKLKGGTSTERLVAHPLPPGYGMTPAQSQAAAMQNYVPPPLSAKRSLASISSYAHMQSISASFPKPPPPPVPHVTIPLSPPQSPPLANQQLGVSGSAGSAGSNGNVNNNKEKEKVSTPVSVSASTPPTLTPSTSVSSSTSPTPTRARVASPILQRKAVPALNDLDGAQPASASPSTPTPSPRSAPAPSPVVPTEAPKVAPTESASVQAKTENSEETAKPAAPAPAVPALNIQTQIRVRTESQLQSQSPPQIPAKTMSRPSTSEGRIGVAKDTVIPPSRSTSIAASSAMAVHAQSRARARQAQGFAAPSPSHSPSRPGSSSSTSAPAPAQTVSAEVQTQEMPAPKETEIVDVANVDNAASGTAALVEYAREMRARMESARTADECRLLVDMFFARAGLGMHVAPSEASSSTPPSTSADGVKDENEEWGVIECLLGGETRAQSPVKDIEVSPGHSAESSEVPASSEPEESTETADSDSSTSVSAEELGAPPTPRSEDDHHNPRHARLVNVTGKTPNGTGAQNQKMSSTVVGKQASEDAVTGLNVDVVNVVEVESGIPSPASATGTPVAVSAGA